MAKALDARLKAKLPFRVADIFAERQALAGRLVRVAATVAKVKTVNGLSMRTSETAAALWRRRTTTWSCWARRPSPQRRQSWFGAGW